MDTVTQIPPPQAGVPPVSPPQAGPAIHASLIALLPDLRRRAARFALSPATAEDLVQDTVERALRFAKQYDPDSNIRAWAYQILFSVFITGYRRRRREKRAMETLTTGPCAWTQRSAFASPDAKLGLTASTETVLGSLPAGFRDVVTLVDLGQHTYREAAELLDLPLGTVMSRLHRGRRLLADRLGPQAAAA